MGLIAGIVLGGAAFWLERNGHPQLAAFTMAIKPIGTLFVNLLSMVVIPLIAAALFAGIAKLGDLRTLGRMLGRTLAFFWATALAGIVLGFAVGAVLLPQTALTPDQQAAVRVAGGADATVIQHAAESIPTGAAFIVQLVPANPFKAAADGNLLPVIVFITIFAVAAASLTVEKRAPLTNIADAATEALIRIVHWVLLFAPLGIAALVAPLITQVGWKLLLAMLGFIVAVIIGELLFITVVYLPPVFPGGVPLAADGVLDHVLACHTADDARRRGQGHAGAASHIRLRPAARRQPQPRRQRGVPGRCRALHRAAL